MGASSLCLAVLGPHVAEGAGELRSLIRTANPVHEGSVLITLHLPRAHLQIPPPMGVRAHHINGGAQAFMGNSLYLGQHLPFKAVHLLSKLSEASPVCRALVGRKL